MKKIFSCALIVFASMVALTSCKDDNDSNPTLVTPTQFVVNSPSVGEALVDLKESKTINLTWSQPTFTTPNAPVVANYEVQISTSGEFTKKYDDAAEDNTGTNYIAMSETFTTCSADVSCEEIAKGIEKVNEWLDETDIPATQAVKLRVRAYVANASQEVQSEVISNVVSINTAPYYIELKSADPELWYLIGGDICDGKWGSGIGESIIPMQTVPDYEYDKKTGQGKITWTGYLAGNGFKLKMTPDSWDNQWGQGDAFGTFVKNDGGSGNITVTEPGYYTVTLNTAKDELSIVKYEEDVTEYSSICVAGDMYGDDWADHSMTPCFSFDGAKNHDWYTTITVANGQGFKFKEAGSWDYNTGGPISTTANGDAYGYGTNNGSNISLPAGTYLVIYNDITRFYRCILQ